MEQEKRRLSWHPAFGAVLRIELEKELDLLESVDERQLTKASGWRRISEGYSRATISLSTNPRRTI